MNGGREGRVCRKEKIRMELGGKGKGTLMITFVTAQNRRKRATGVKSNWG